MPPKVICDNHTLNEDARRIHQGVFNVAIIAAHTMSTAIDYYNRNLAIPPECAKHSEWGVTFSEASLFFLGRSGLTLREIDIHRNSLEPRAVWGRLMHWLNKIEQVTGTPLAKDDPFEWSIYDLMKIIENARSLIRDLESIFQHLPQRVLSD